MFREAATRFSCIFFHIWVGLRQGSIGACVSLWLVTHLVNRENVCGLLETCTGFVTCAAALVHKPWICYLFDILQECYITRLIWFIRPVLKYFLSVWYSSDLLSSSLILYNPTVCLTISYHSVWYSRERFVSAAAVPLAHKRASSSLFVFPTSNFAHMHNGYQSSLNVGSEVLAHFYTIKPRKWCAYCFLFMNLYYVNYASKNSQGVSYMVIESCE